MKYGFTWPEDLTWVEIAIWDEDGGEGDGAGDEGDDDDGDEGGSNDPVPKAGDKKPNGKTFTQEEVDKIVVKRNKAVKRELENVEKRYESLLKEQNLTKEAREGLEADLENVRKQMRTEKEQLQHEKRLAEEKYQTELAEANKQANFYKTQFETNEIKRALQDSAISSDAYEPSQIVTLLRDRTKLVDELDGEGKKTGRQIAMVEWEYENPETKQIELGFRKPEEVLKAMKEDTKRYGNLFKSNVAAGLGSGTAGVGGRGGKVDVRSMTPDEYMKFAQTPEGRKALGLSR